MANRSRPKSRPTLTVRPWVLTLLAVVVIVVWAVNIMAGLFVHEWHSDTGVDAVMGALIALLGTLSGKSLLARATAPKPPAEADADDS